MVCFRETGKHLNRSIKTFFVGVLIVRKLNGSIVRLPRVPNMLSHTERCRNSELTHEAHRLQMIRFPRL